MTYDKSGEEERGNLLVLLVHLRVIVVQQDHPDQLDA